MRDMKIIRGLVGLAVLSVVVIASPGLQGADGVSDSYPPMPPGIGVRMTHEGPVFTDAAGMTLYTIDLPVPCDSQRFDTLLTRDSAFEKVTVTALDAAHRSSCVQKNPPLLAPDNAEPVDRWSIVMREDGTRHWAYDGKPLHRSIKDRVPGDINGATAPFFPGFSGYGRALAIAPLAGAPAGVIARKTHLGLALTLQSGKTLYFPENADVRPDSRLWTPLAAPVLATADPSTDWSVVKRRDGTLQWAYAGQPLYTHRHDREGAARMLFSDVFGGAYQQPFRVVGWRVALLQEAAKHPAQVTVRSLRGKGDIFYSNYMPIRRIYTDLAGKALYTFYCIEETLDKADCDDVGDSPRYWLNACGGEQQCAGTWRPFEAPPNAKRLNNEWSVVRIHAHHPWKPIEDGSPTVNVWAYRGRPVFTNAYDRPGHPTGATPPGGAFVDGPLYILAYQPRTE
jgi:predicted lipoprotein with Yx(FWY)xxD motif